MKLLVNRFLDVLVALQTAQGYNQSLGRIQLQKVIYLSDILSIIWRVNVPEKKHIVYKNGPYDGSIQDAVDILAFRGAVKTIKADIISKSRVGATYTISQTGKEILDEMVSQSLIRRKVELYNTMAVKINERGWGNLMKMVYLEPTFVDYKIDRWMEEIDSSSIFTNTSLRILVDFDKMLNHQRQDVPLSKEALTLIFFKLLDNLSGLKNE